MKIKSQLRVRLLHGHVGQYAKFEQFDQQNQKQVLCQCNSKPLNAPFETNKKKYPFQN